MSVLLFYLLKASVCMGVFYAFYRLVLSNSSFHQWNRVFLMTTITASLVIPFIALPAFQANETIQYSRDFMLQAQNLLTEASNANESASIASVIFIILGVIYGLGVLLRGISFVQDMRKVRALIRSNRHQQDGKFVLIETNAVPTSSFFHYIFINRENLSDVDLAQVVRHEQAHSQAKHSLDVMFLCVLHVFFWFNPLINLIRKTVEELHEYMVDEIVVKHSSIPQYSRLLLQLATKPGSIQLTSGFAKIQLKKRIIMLNQNKTNNMKKLKFLFAAPLAAMMVFVFTSASQAQKRSDVIGKWRGVDVIAKSLKPNAAINPEVFNAGKKVHQASRYQLNKDGSFTMSSPQGSKSGKWKLNGSYLKIDLGNMKITQLTSNKMALLVYASLKTGGEAKSKEDADFALTYIYTKE